MNRRRFAAVHVILRRRAPFKRRDPQFCSAIATLARPDYIRAVEPGPGELASGRDAIDEFHDDDPRASF
jgi:hypothetical protein